MVTTYVITVVMKQAKFGDRPNGRKTFRLKSCRSIDDAVDKLEQDLLVFWGVKDYWIEYIYQDRPIGRPLLVSNADKI